MAANKKKTKAIEFQIGWPGLIALVISTFAALLWVFVLGFWMGQKVISGNCPKTKVAVYNPKTHSVFEDAAILPSTEQDVPRNEAFKKIESIKESLKEEAKKGDSGSGELGGPGPIKTEVIKEAKIPAIKDEAEKKAEVAPVEKKEAESIGASQGKTIEAKSQEQGKLNAKVKKIAETIKKSETSSVKKEEASKRSDKASKVKKVKTVKAKPKAATKRYFALQIASYRSLEQARRGAKIWEKKGYPVKIRKANLGAKGIWYRVYIGKYKSMEAAKKAAVRLAAKEGIRSYLASFDH